MHCAVSWWNGEWVFRFCGALIGGSWSLYRSIPVFRVNRKFVCCCVLLIHLKWLWYCKPELSEGVLGVMIEFLPRFICVRCWLFPGIDDDHHLYVSICCNETAIVITNPIANNAWVINRKRDHCFMCNTNKHTLNVHRSFRSGRNAYLSVPNMIACTEREIVIWCVYICVLWVHYGPIESLGSYRCPSAEPPITIRYQYSGLRLVCFCFSDATSFLQSTNNAFWNRFEFHSFSRWVQSNLSSGMWVVSYTES